MTVAALPSTVSYLEDGASTAFAVPFRFRAAADLVVERVAGGAAVALQLGVDYSVSGGDTDAGGVVRRSAATSGARLRISRRTARAQPMVYTVDDRFPAKSHEEALDRLTLITQEMDALVDDVTARALLLPPGEHAAELPAAPSRAGGVLVFDHSTGAPVVKPETLFAPGAPGPAGATYLTLAAFKAAPISNLKQALKAPGIAFGDYFFELGDFTGRADDDNVIKADEAALTVGAWVRQRADGVSFDDRSLGDKLRENAAVTDTRFAGGANSNGGADATAAFAAAKRSARQIATPGYRFLLGNLLLDRDYQRWDLWGATWAKAARGPVATITGRGVRLIGGKIEGDGSATDNIVVKGQEAEIRVMSNRATAGHAVYAEDANATIVFGGIHKTEDARAEGWDIVFRNTGVGSLYNKVIAIATNQNSGGILFDGSGANHVVGCQFGKFGAINGGGAFVAASRIGGAAYVKSSSSFTACNFAKDILVGQDGEPNIGNIGIGATVFQQSGKTVDIADNVVESSFFLDQMVHAGTTINIRSPANAIYLRGQPVTLGIGAQSGSPTLGDAAVRATVSYLGWQRVLRGTIVMARTTNLGSGNYFYLIAPFKTASTAIGTALFTDAGAGFFTAVARMLAGSDQIFFFPSSGAAATDNPAAVTHPFSWTTGDILEFEITFEHGV